MTFTSSKTEARDIERAVLMACRSGDYQHLDQMSRELCIRMFANQAWEMPPGLMIHQPKNEVNLWEAIKIFLSYDEVRYSQGRDRYEIALLNLVEYFGKDRSVKSIKVPDIKKFMFDRLNTGRAEATVNREKGTLSRMFQVLQELEYVDNNPVEGIKNLSEKSGQREVYLSRNDVQTIIGLVPSWLKPIIETAYYTGMRRGEILGLTRRQVNLSSRIIRLNAEDTKEGHQKRIPIHRDLVSVLRKAMKVTSLEDDRVFLIRDGKGVRSPSKHSPKNAWRKAVTKLGLVDPRPRFHDLRHTWKTNARRSGIDFEIRESIMGHSTRTKSVAERYGRISDEELLQAIDMMTFDHGSTEIVVAGKRGTQKPEKNVNFTLTIPHKKEKGHAHT
jgi:integrase